MVTVVGLCIVFSVLIILWVLLSFMKVFSKKESGNTAAEGMINKSTDTADTLRAAAEEESADEEIVAVITAAVAASLHTSTYNLKIKSIKRTPNTAPAWNRAGINEVIRARF